MGDDNSIIEQLKYLYTIGKKLSENEEAILLLCERVAIFDSWLQEWTEKNRYPNNPLLEANIQSLLNVLTEIGGFVREVSPKERSIWVQAKKTFSNAFFHEKVTERLTEFHQRIDKCALTLNICLATIAEDERQEEMNTLRAEMHEIHVHCEALMGQLGSSLKKYPEELEGLLKALREDAGGEDSVTILREKLKVQEKAPVSIIMSDLGELERSPMMKSNEAVLLAGNKKGNDEFEGEMVAVKQAGKVTRRTALLEQVTRSLIHMATSGNVSVLQELEGMGSINKIPAEVINRGTTADLSDDKWGKGLEDVTALHIAATLDHVEIVRLLLLHPQIEVNAVDDKGPTVLRISVIYNRVEIVRLLLLHPKIAVNDIDNMGVTVLHISAVKNFPEIMRLLLLHAKIDVNAADGMGVTALHISAALGHVEIVRLLLLHPQIEVNAVDSENQVTPFYLACQRGKIEVVRVLLSQDGLEMDKPDKNGNTAFDVAQTEAIKQLILREKARRRDEW
eukprot:scaffold367_cov274-Ochromonas_danica.AAC.4